MRQNAVTALFRTARSSAKDSTSLVLKLHYAKYRDILRVRGPLQEDFPVRWSLFRNPLDCIKDSQLNLEPKVMSHFDNGWDWSLPRQSEAKARHALVIDLPFDRVASRGPEDVGLLCPSRLFSLDIVKFLLLRALSLSVNLTPFETPSSAHASPGSFPRPGTPRNATHA